LSITLENETDFDINENLLEKFNLIAKDFTNKDIEVLLTDNEKIRQINKEYRNIDKETDVISFPFEDIPHSPLGSIVISIQKAKEEAKRLNHSVEDEITLLFIHALLHLLGFDHEKDRGEMREKEKELIDKYNLPKSLIIRSES